MSLTITHDFIAHQDARAEEVNQNFQDVETWANNLETVIKVGSGSVHRIGGLYEQSISSNSLKSNQVIYRGWSFATGTGASILATQDIVLPNNGYDDANYDIVVHIIGMKVGSDPASRTDVGTTVSNNVMIFNGGFVQTATQFKVRVVDIEGVNLVNGNRWLFSWFTIGTKT